MKNNSVLGDLSELIQAYSQLEELAAKLLKINIDQLENRISNPEAERILLDLANEQIDLDRKIFQLKKQMGFIDVSSKGEQDGNEHNKQ